MSTPTHQPRALLYALATPSPSLALSDFDSWYNSSHGPHRVRLPFVHRGLRYRASDALGPPWLATYDLASVACMQEPAYTALRETRSQREVDIVERGGLDVLDRRVYQVVLDRGREEGGKEEEGEGGKGEEEEGGKGKEAPPVLLAVTLSFAPEHADEVVSWYKDEHIGLLSQIPGWQRSRLFRRANEKSGQPYVSPAADGAHAETLGLHEFGAENGIEGPEHQRAKATPWRERVMALAERHERRLFAFYHEFRAEDLVEEE